MVKNFIKIIFIVFLQYQAIFSNISFDDLELNCNHKKALIFGITGQDGTYLTKFLLSKGYFVTGVIRRQSSSNAKRFSDIIKRKPDQLIKNLNLVNGDITDLASILKILNDTKPDEIYNLAAQSHVDISFEEPTYTAQTNAIGTLNILEAIRNTGLAQTTKLYNASTSELFGKTINSIQDETTYFYPRSPYGIAKLYSHWISVNYRESYKIYVCNGILFNHESPLRGENFISKIIASSIAKIKLGLQDKLTVGNINSRRDWGYAPEYVESMWLMLQQEVPDDYIIATGESHSVREFIELAFNEIDIAIEWQGEGINEIGFDKKTKKILVTINPKYFRPSDINSVCGNSRKAKEKLGWQAKTLFKDLVKIIVNYELENLQNNRSF